MRAADPLLPLLLLVALAACQPDFTPASRLLAGPLPDGAAPVQDVQRDYFAGDTSRPRHEVGYLLYPDGSKKRNGPEREWWPGGQLRSERGFAEDRPVGEWRTWFESGALRSSFLFDPSGAESEARWLHENGQVSSSGPFRNGVKWGVWTSWYADGTEASRGGYVAGQRDGEWVFWHEDGELDQRGSFRAGVKIGAWTYGPRPKPVEPESPGDPDSGA